MNPLTPTQTKAAVGIAIAVLLGAWWSQRDTVEEEFILLEASDATNRWCVQASPIQFAIDGIDDHDYVYPRGDWIAKLRGDAGPFSIPIDDHADQVEQTLVRLSREADGDSGLQAVLWDLRGTMSEALTAVNRARDAETADAYVANIALIEARCASMWAVPHGMLLGRK